MRDRAYRRAQTERYKKKQQRDVAARQNKSGALQWTPKFFSDTRHHFDCGHRCFMCSGEKLIFGQRRERYAARQIINEQIGE